MDPVMAQEIMTFELIVASFRRLPALSIRENHQPHKAFASHFTCKLPNSPPLEQIIQARNQPTDFTRINSLILYGNAVK